MKEGRSGGGGGERKSVSSCSCISPQAEKFVLSLPKDKRPVRGTPGERYRNHQLMRQLPVYDIDIGHMRSELNTDEEKQMELFLKLRRDNALGRGRVREKESVEQNWVGGKGALINHETENQT